MSAKHTKGPWTVTEGQEWPWDIAITAGDDRLFSLQRCASSTAQKTLADCMDAVGFDWKQRDEVQERLARQMADVRLAAAAPDLLAALILLEKRCGPNAPDGEIARAAIARATGAA